MICFIPTKGRLKTKTYKLFQDVGIEVKHFIEPQEIEKYNVPNKVSISLVSTIDALVNTTIPVIYLDLNQRPAIMASPSGGNGLKNKILGCLRYSGTGANNYLYADTTTNPPMYIQGRPTNNNILIEIHTNQAGGMTNYSPTAWEYVMTLNLEEC